MRHLYALHFEYGTYLNINTKPMVLPLALTVSNARLPIIPIAWKGCDGSITTMYVVLECPFFKNGTNIMRLTDDTSFEYRRQQKLLPFFLHKATDVVAYISKLTFKKEKWWHLNKELNSENDGIVLLREQSDLLMIDICKTLMQTKKS